MTLAYLNLLIKFNSKEKENSMEISGWLLKCIVNLMERLKKEPRIPNIMLRKVIKSYDKFLKDNKFKNDARESITTRVL